jgi:hypothetical protein
MKNIRILKGALALLIFFCLITGAIFLSRSAFLPHTLAGIIVPELEEASGQTVSFEEISLNILPLFVEARGIRVSDSNGNDVATVKRVKGNIDLSGLLRRNISLRRLLIDEPVISAEREKIETIINNIKAYLETERETAFKVKIKVVEIIHGSANLSDADLRAKAGIKGLAGEMIMGENQRLRAAIKEIAIEKEGWPGIKCDLDTALVLKKDGVDIKKLEIGSYGTRVSTEGFYSKDQGVLRTELALLVDSIKRIFNLTEKGDGRISAKGEVRLAGNQSPELNAHLFSKIFVDIKLSGDFYLQTLMEFLKVRDRLEGNIEMTGEISGRLSDITGKAKARLSNGNLYGVDVDSLACNVFYNDGVMRFEKGSASLYNGTAKADASINLPVVNFFTLNVKFAGVDSKAALKLIGWEPEIPPGKVDGELATSGHEFNPEGSFVYRTPPAAHRTILKGQDPPVNNVLNRIREIKGHYSLHSHILSLTDLHLRTRLSRLSANGSVNLEKRTLRIWSRLHADDISDLSLPYYREIKGRGEFSGEVTGLFENPGISGKMRITDGVIEGYKSDAITADFSYEKSRLDIREAVFRSHGEEHRIKGTISFPDAEELFDLNMPVYNLNASLSNADLGKTGRIFYRDFSAKGALNADVKIGGRGEAVDISGKASIKQASVYQVPFDSASGAFKFKKREFSVRDAKITKGKSVVSAGGMLSLDGRFNFSAASEEFLAGDAGVAYLPENIAFSFRSEGHGTLDDPAITVDGRVVGGNFKGIGIGSGTLKAALKNKKINAEAALFNEKMRLRASGYLDDILPWSAELIILPGRYDPLVGLVLKDLPEDLQLNLEGRLEMKGDRNNISASANINRLTLSLFGQTLSNDTGINFTLNNRNLSFAGVVIKSGATSFRLHGGLEIGRSYDIVLDGSSSLAPLKTFSNKIGYLNGDAKFVFSVTGRWDKPDINGGMEVTNASFGLRDYPSYVSSINGYLYVDEDRIVLQRLSGKIGGGNVNISGLVYLKGFIVKRFYLETALTNITTSPSKEFSLNFEGNIVYKGTLEAQTITGDIRINRARYREMVEWRSWLLTAKAIEKPRAEGTVFEKAGLNIRISGAENISIDNNFARAPVSIRGDMIVKGTIARPILYGRLESNDGYVYFRNNEFRIIFASIDFADPNRIKPLMNLTAETSVKGYDIRLNLEGQTDRFSLSLSSDPYLEEVDILALLTVGQVVKQLKGLEGGIGAGTATSFITGKAQDVIEERVRTLTGLDRFQVEPYVSKKTSTVEPRVTVSERLIGDRLFVTYTTSLNSTEEQVIKVEYLLEKNISLVGVRDEKGVIGGDIKFRFGFK